MERRASRERASQFVVSVRLRLRHPHLVLVMRFSIFVACLVACLSGCVAVPPGGEYARVRKEVLGNLCHLREAWSDWIELFEATDVLEGRFSVSTEDLRQKQEQYIQATVQDFRVLLGQPPRQPSGARQVSIFNTKETRYPQCGLYTNQIERVNNKECVSFLHHEWLCHCSGGKVLPIIPAEDSSVIRPQLESFLYLATMDVDALVDLAAMADARVESVMQKLKLTPSDREAVQAGLDDLGRVGTEILPGILHAMRHLLRNPASNHELRVDFVLAGGGYQVPRNMFEFLLFSAGTLTSMATPPDSIEDQWRKVRRLALQVLVLKSECLLESATTMR